MATEYSLEDDEFYEEDENDIITAEDCWTVISSFFDTKGLVSLLDTNQSFVPCSQSSATKSSSGQSDGHLCRHPSDF